MAKMAVCLTLPPPLYSEIRLAFRGSKRSKYPVKYCITAGIGISYVSPRFHSTDVLWNLGQTCNISDPAVIAIS